MLNPETERQAENLANIIASCLEENKPVMLASIAALGKVSELDVAKALPQAMRAFAPAGTFEEVWAEMATWEKATFIMQHLGSVLEIKAAIPSGNHGHGYFNLNGASPLQGHLKIDDLGEICFLSMPFMGLESHSVQFFNADGNVKFSVYVGRGEDRKLLPLARESFLKMRAAMAKEIC